MDLTWAPRGEAELFGDEALQQAQLPGPSEGLGPAMDAQLAMDVLDVLLGRCYRDHEPIGDLAVREPIADEPQHLELALAQ